ncbi:MAG TPA: cyclic nucleotide-binding domain-containing protein [Spirochaetota bacterium]|nr:cyclic nucleotide-binding domain-containing protein [Spirochaetota bacterium]
MSQNGYIRLYQSSSEPEEAYLLARGNVYFFVSEVDKYVIRGQNLIVGATELILGNMTDISTPRMETAITDHNSRIKKMPREKFIASLGNYSFVLNASMVLAKQVTLTNNIMNKNMTSLEGDDKKIKELSVEFYRIVRRIKDEYGKRKLPWLKDVTVKHENTLTYKRGETFDRPSGPTVISTECTMKDKFREFPTGTVICEAGSQGDEMYILESGAIDVVIKGNRVATISDRGTVFGEMALLLGETRSATLKAKNDVVLTAISKKDLREIAAQNTDILTAIAVSLAKKHYFNIEKINSVNEMLIEKELHGDEEKLEKKRKELQHTTSELLSLKKDVRTMHSTKPAEFIDDLVDTFD